MDKFNNTGLSHYLLSSGFWAFIGQALRIVLGAAMPALLARILSPNDMGVYSLAFSLVYFCSIISGIGLENTLLRFVSDAMGHNQPYQALEIIRKGLVLTSISTLLTVIFIYFVAGTWLANYLFHSTSLIKVIGYISIWLVFYTIKTLFSTIFRALQDIRSAVLFGGSSDTLIVFVLLIFYWHYIGQATLDQVFTVILAAVLINTIIAVWILTHKMKTLSLERKDLLIMTSYWDLLNHSWPLLMTAFMTVIMGQVATWFLAFLRSGEDVAVYSAASRLASLIQVALVVVNMVVSPLIAKFYAQGRRKDIEGILRTTATLAAIPALLLQGIFILFGGDVMRIVYGDYYIRGAQILAILGFGQAITVFVGSCEYALIMTGHRKIMAFLFFVILLPGGALSWLLISSHGVLGAAFATTVMIVSVETLVWLSVYKRTGIWTHINVNPVRLLNNIKSVLVMKG